MFIVIDISYKSQEEEEEKKTICPSPEETNDVMCPR